MIAARYPLGMIITDLCCNTAVSCNWRTAGAGSQSPRRHVKRSISSWALRATRCPPCPIACVLRGVARRTCKDGRGQDQSLDLFGASSRTQTTVAGAYAGTAQDACVPSFARGSRSGPLPSTPCDAAVGCSSRHGESTPRCLSGAVTHRWVASPGRVRRFPIPCGCTPAIHVAQHTLGMAADLQQEAPFTSRPLHRENGGQYSNFKRMLAMLCNHRLRRESPVGFKASFRCTTSGPGRCESKVYTCSHCMTPTRRRLDIFCRRCGRVLQPQYDGCGPSGYSFFELLELEPDFNVDLTLLDSRHKTLQRKLHPDKNLDANEEERKWSDEHRRHVTRAVAILRCPAKRLLHLLQHHFRCLPVHLDEENVERVTDSSLLAEVLELNEALEGVRNRQELDTFEKKIRELLQLDEKALEATFQKKDFEGMRLGAQRYLMHAALLDRIRNWSSNDTS